MNTKLYWLRTFGPETALLRFPNALRLSSGGHPNTVVYSKLALTQRALSNFFAQPSAPNPTSSPQVPDPHTHRHRNTLTLKLTLIFH